MKPIYLIALITLATILYGQQSFAAAEAVNLNQQLRDRLLNISHDTFAFGHDIIKNMLQTLESRVASYQEIINLLEAGANPNYIPIHIDDRRRIKERQYIRERDYGKFKDAYHIYLILDCAFGELLDTYLKNNPKSYKARSYENFIDMKVKLEKAFENAIAKKLLREKRLLREADAPPAYEAIAEEEGPKKDVEQAELGLGEWACNMCTLLNNPDAKICDICRAPKSVAPGGL